MGNNDDLQNPEVATDGQETEVEQPTAAPNEDKLTFAEQVETLTTELNKALEDVEAHKDAAIRATAESENIRRRAEREVSNASKFALERFAKEILAVVDSLEKALEHPVENEVEGGIREGIELTYKLLTDILAKFSIQQISPLGDVFDPALHEAMVMAESAEHEPNSVMQVIQMGYSLNGRLIRPARVIVSKGKSPELDEKA